MVDSQFEKARELALAWQKKWEVHSRIIDPLEYEDGRELLSYGKYALTAIFGGYGEGIELDAQIMFVLCRLTGENPIDKEHSGFIELMGEDWRTWAREHGYHVKTPPIDSGE